MSQVAGDDVNVAYPMAISALGAVVDECYFTELRSASPDPLRILRYRHSHFSIIPLRLQLVLPTYSLQVGTQYSHNSPPSLVYRANIFRSTASARPAASPPALSSRLSQHFLAPSGSLDPLDANSPTLQAP